MNKIVKHILNIFVKNPKKLYSRQEIEKLVSGIGKRTIIRTLSMLEKDKRIETVGQRNLWFEI